MKQQWGEAERSLGILFRQLDLFPQIRGAVSPLNCLDVEEKNSVLHTRRSNVSKEEEGGDENAYPAGISALKVV